MPQVTFKTIDAADVAGKRVLVRVDLNVPMKNGKVTDATRIERAAPTIAELAAKGAKVVVLSHFGRPDGKQVPEMSLKALVEPLSVVAQGVLKKCGIQPGMDVVVSGCGIMGLMEGVMAGIMGGTMGPMISVMMVLDHVELFMPLFMLFSMAVLFGLTYMIILSPGRGPARKPDWDFSSFAALCLSAVLLLSAIMVWGPKGAAVI